ncbi:hypothetical protein ACFLIM_43000 [Nonomuraea sp. M3C6]|uniref:Gram-positive cocci surface proteins LPxTG domain-containing protein n=1 Tax=Nonomuraea marmarensis TaxID=3351344 RepID=A0ABW7ARB2_9ACTN
MPKARRCAVTAFVIAGVTLTAGIGTASAQSSPQLPDVVPSCLLPLPLPLLCDEPPDDSPSDGPAPEESWSSPPEDGHPEDSRPGTVESAHPWRPAGENEHQVPRGHPETGGGGLATDGPAWPFALGGAALLAGAGLTGVAVRRRKGVA